MTLILGLFLTAVAADADTTWSYSTGRDEMDREILLWASVEATRTVDVGFPYGPHRPDLELRTKYGKDLVVMIGFEGQANQNDLHGGEIRIKFDDKKPVTWRFVMPADPGKTGLIFLKNESAMVQRLWTAQTLTVELDYYSHGREVCSFPVAGLDIKQLGLSEKKKP